MNLKRIDEALKKCDSMYTPCEEVHRLLEEIKDETQNRKFYFITVFEKLEVNDLGWPETGSQRCWGFYLDKDIAFQAVHENWTDLEETIYDYALIEEYEEGISHLTGYRQWFKFDIEKKGYVEIDEPEGYKHFVGFALG